MGTPMSNRRELLVRCAIAVLAMTGIACAQSGDGMLSGTPEANPVRQRAVPSLPEAGVSLVPEDLATLKLSAGMLLRYSVYSAPETEATLRVTADGLLPVPLIGDVKVAGLTMPSLGMPSRRRSCRVSILCGLRSCWRLYSWRQAI
jgi:hypothetical protein